MRYIERHGWLRSVIGAAAAFTLLTGASGCSDIFDVRTPGVVEESTIDPQLNAEEFSRSALQNLNSAYANLIVYTAWFNHEMWVGDTFPTRNEFGRRFIDVRNGTHNGANWVSPQRAIRLGEDVIELLTGVEGQELNLARGAFASAYGITLQSEAFCELTMAGPGRVPQGLMTPEQMFQTALTRFDLAISAAAQATGSEARSIETASRIGRARALLNLGRNAEAAQAAEGIDPDFVFNLLFIDDASFRGRLGNGVFAFSCGGNRESLVVPGPFGDSPGLRAIGTLSNAVGEPLEGETGDPRIPFMNCGRLAQDNTLQFWSQRKYPGWAASIPLAEGLEARYIAVEARNDPAEMLAFVNERRAVGGEGPFDGADVRKEFFRQHTLDFWLTTKRMGAWRRNGDQVMTFLLPPGPYYKDAIGDIENQSCFPLPLAERVNNPEIGT